MQVPCASSLPISAYEGLGQDFNLSCFLPFGLFSNSLIVNDKSQNLRRLQAQRNELNAKGEEERWEGCMEATGVSSECSVSFRSGLHLSAHCFHSLEFHCNLLKHMNSRL